jgi:hypothetical protein
MLSILLLLVAQLPVVMCHGDPVCLAANEFRGRYSEWTHVVNATTPGTIDARETGTWHQVEIAFYRLRRAEKQ